MIPESWLKEHLNTTDLNELAKREALSLGLSDSALQHILRQGPAPRFAEEWRRFIEQMLPGDELWWFESPPETWAALAGAAGYALVRSKQILDTITTRRS